MACRDVSVIDVFIGVLTRCLTSLEQKDIDGSKSTDTSDALREVGRSSSVTNISHMNSAVRYM